MRTRFKENADSTENPEKSSESPTNQQFLNAACLDFRIRRLLPACRPALLSDLIKNHLHRLRRSPKVSDTSAVTFSANARFCSIVWPSYICTFRVGTIRSLYSAKKKMRSLCAKQVAERDKFFAPAYGHHSGVAAKIRYARRLRSTRPNAPFTSQRFSSISTQQPRNLR